MIRSKIFLWLMLSSLYSLAQEYEYDYNFFTNSLMAGDHFYSVVEHSNGSFVVNRNFKIPVSATMFHTPGNALQLVYINAKNGHWQATVYHQAIRGQDKFKKATYLSFWIYPSTTDSILSDLPSVQLMKADSSLSNKIPIRAARPNEWQQVLVPVTSIQGMNPSDPEKMIAVVFSQQENKSSRKQTLYIDDIEMLPAGTTKKISGIPEITSVTGYPMHIDLTWKLPTGSGIKAVKIYRSENGTDFKPIGLQQPWVNRFADYTGTAGKKYYYRLGVLDYNYEEPSLSKTGEASTRSISDDALMSMVQEASFRYYWEGAENNSGMSLENTGGRQNMVATGASGFGIMAIIAGAERSFISKTEAALRMMKIISFLEKAETFHGAYPHFINGANGKVEPFFGKRDNGADLVETSFLVQGLLAARQYFSGNNANERTIREKITSIWKKTEWVWFRQTPDSKFLYWHWSPDQGWVINHKLIGWNETMVTYLLAIASPSHAVPASMYYSGWANQDSTGRKYREAWSQSEAGNKYTNGNSYYGVKLDAGVSTGGPLFFTHYSYLGYDPHLITDNYTNYFRNNQRIARINHRYCIENPNNYQGYSDSAWGLTASDGPFGYAVDEPVKSRDHGKITPTGAISSFPYTPEESMRALKNYYFNYGHFLWGEYGFRDAFDLNNNWCSPIYMGLNQAPMVVMIENYRSGLLWKLFMADPDIKAGMEKLQFETNLMINKRREKPADN